MNRQLLRLILLGTMALAFSLVGNRAEARWYSPETAGFISRAPYPPAVEHPYSFGMQNPTGWFDATGREPMPANREEFCKNDPCKGKTVTSGKGNSFKGGEDCSGSCFDWATSQSNNAPPKDSKPPGDNWHQDPGGEIIYYHGTWLGSGHGAIYDPASGCAASCSKGDWTGTTDPAAPGAKMRVVVHHPACHPRGRTDSPWHDPWYWY